MNEIEFSKEENISFWKNMVLVVVFFSIAPITLGVSLFSLLSLKTTSLIGLAVGKNNYSSSYSGVQVYASLPPQLPSVSDQIGADDARPEIIREYLSYYNSPLTPYADLIVKTADDYHLDYRLITAIAQQESNLCKIIPPRSYNCWGWGITGSSNLSFNSYQEGILKVSKGLKTQYIDKGYTTVDQIMTRYNPISPGGAEAKSIAVIMGQME